MEGGDVPMQITILPSVIDPGVHFLLWCGRADLLSTPFIDTIFWLHCWVLSFSVLSDLGLTR